MYIKIDTPIISTKHFSSPCIVLIYILTSSQIHKKSSEIYMTEENIKSRPLRVKKKLWSSWTSPRGHPESYFNVACSKLNSTPTSSSQLPPPVFPILNGSSPTSSSWLWIWKLEFSIPFSLHNQQISTSWQVTS